MESRYIGIPVASFIGTEQFDAAWDAASVRKPRQPRAYRLFSMAFCGLGYRLRASVERRDAFLALHRQHGGSSHEGNFLQDQAFVDYLLNTCSAVDCCCFAAFAALAIISPGSIQLEHAKSLKVDRKRVAGLMTSAMPLSPLTAAIQELSDSPVSRQLFDYRDVVAHRGTLPRTVYIGGEFSGRVTVPSNPKDIPDAWSSSFVVGPEALLRFHPWLEMAVSEAVRCIQCELDLVAIEPAPPISDA